MLKTALILTSIAAITALSVVFWWFCVQPWSDWRNFAAEHIQRDGRVIDYTDGNRSTSEGQAYALFFALIADDKARFEKILAWTRDNLAQGNLSTHLPAWHWGQTPAGNWTVLDTNPASDADLWLAYTLLEAGRLWQMGEYTKTADAILRLIQKFEIETLPGAGPMLLPAPHGFRLEEGGWRLNPSYLPGFILKRLAQHQPAGPWVQIQQTAQDLLVKASPEGIVPDWYIYTPAGKVQADNKSEALGSYEAIRVYLWQGLWSTSSSSGDWQATRGLPEVVATFGKIPERINTLTGAPANQAPSGFYRALLPYWQWLRDNDRHVELADQYLGDFKRSKPHSDDPSDYYGRVLNLFGSGGYSKRFRIDAQGQTVPRWSRFCCEILH